MEQDDVEQKSIKNNIKAFRKRLGMTQREVAIAAGLSVSYVTEIEKGKKGASYAVTKALAPVLGCSACDFYEEDLRCDHSKAEVSVQAPDIVRIAKKLEALSKQDRQLIEQIVNRVSKG